MWGWRESCVCSPPPAANRPQQVKDNSACMEVWARCGRLRTERMKRQGFKWMTLNKNPNLVGPQGMKLELTSTHAPWGQETDTDKPERKGAKPWCLSYLASLAQREDSLAARMGTHWEQESHRPVPWAEPGLPWNLFWDSQIMPNWKARPSGGKLQTRSLHRPPTAPQVLPKKPNIPVCLMRIMSGNCASLI